jgi:two-component system sensor histidine kinase UhpB
VVPKLVRVAGAFAGCATVKRMRKFDPRRRYPVRYPVRLFWLIFVPNAAVLMVAGTALAIFPVTAVSEEREVVVGGALLLMLLFNSVLIRSVLTPLEELSRLMEQIDPRRPGTRIKIAGRSVEFARVTSTFNAMLSRIELERAESDLRKLVAQEEERRRLAMELHDEVGQSLTALMLDSARAADQAPPGLAAELREIQESTRQLSDRVRDIIRGLRPEALDDLGLRSALLALSADFARRSGLKVIRRISRELPALAPEVELAVYRVAQEGLTNVARHAEASRVEISLSSGAELELIVRDNGRGTRGGSAGSGIEGMHERARLVGGRLEINGDEGCTVKLTVPLQEGAR